jgi:ribosome recycling factor
MSELTTPEQIKKDAETRMKKSLDALAHALGNIRTGRAHPSLIEDIKVNSYGTEMSLKNVASITSTDARTLVVTPFDASSLSSIEKAIQMSDLGLNPIPSGKLLRVPFPALTEERRKQFVGHAKKEAEETKVAVRNIRRDANNSVDRLLKAKEIPEDQKKNSEKVIQKLTDDYIANIEKLLAQKEKDLLED